MSSQVSSPIEFASNSEAIIADEFVKDGDSNCHSPISLALQQNWPESSTNISENNEARPLFGNKAATLPTDYRQAHERQRHFTLCNLNTRFVIKALLSLSLLIGTLQCSFTIALAGQGKSVRQGGEIKKMLDDGRCDQVWKEVWKVARTGNSETLASIALLLIAYRGLVPPSYFALSKSAVVEYSMNNFMALILYARRDEDASQMLRRSGILDEEDMSSASADDISKIREVNKCFKSEEDSLDFCFEKAVRFNIIPSFEQYVSLMDHAPRPAFCLPGENSPK